MVPKWTKIKSMQKLSDKDIEYCKELIKSWYKIKEVCKMYRVSFGYLYYHWVRRVQ